MDANTDPHASAADQDRAMAQARLSEALRRARWALLWERSWPHLARILTVVGLFLAASWAGLWVHLPATLRTVALILFAALAVAGAGAAHPVSPADAPRGAQPSRSRLRYRASPRNRADRYARLVAGPVAQALWQEHVARTLSSVKSIRAGLPSPRLALHDPRALRALVAVLVVATFFAAGGERLSRITAAFNWQGLLPVSNVRLDAWVTPPAYTNRAPIILAGSQVNPATDHRDAMTVPAGSVLVIRASGGKLDVTVTGAVADAPPAEGVAPPAGAEERRFVISGNGSAQVRSPSGQPAWQFTALPDRTPTISLTKDPERQARGALILSYKIEDDYGVTEARAALTRKQGGADTRPLFDAPEFPLVMPNARTRNGIGQTVRDLTEHPFAGADLMLTLTARDEAGNEGTSEPCRVEIAGAAVHQAAGAGAGRTAARTGARCQSAEQCADGAGCALDRAGRIYARARCVSVAAQYLARVVARRQGRSAARSRCRFVVARSRDRRRHGDRCHARFCRRRRMRCVRRSNAAPATKKSRS